MMLARKAIFIILLLFSLVMQPHCVLACGTCGCSELCPLTMMKDTESGGNEHGLLSESIWGSIILKIAYQRDPVLQKLVRHKKGVNALMGGSVGSAIGGTFAQDIVSVGTLNPPPGQSDSYLPGGLGVGMSGLVNVAFDVGIAANWHLNKKIKARQLVISQRVESILNHLEKSDAECPNAQADLTEIIGAHAAADCLKLWHSSHTYAAMAKDKTLSQEQRLDYFTGKDDVVLADFIAESTLRAAAAAPNPLSMLTTVSPAAQELSIVRSADRPSKLAP
jgi:hypothetical protein